MQRESSYVLILAILLSLIIAVPADICASPQATGQRAGEVSRLIPAVSIARGSKTINASAKSVVEWQDLLNTKADARARIALDDGSVLNVGSDSSIKVFKHDVWRPANRARAGLWKAPHASTKDCKTRRKI